MRVLFVSTECAPWVKTGGLGDVSSALPAALVGLGHDVRVLLPAYPAVRGLLPQADRVLPLPARGSWPAAKLCRVVVESFELWLLDCPAFYDRSGSPYGDETGADHTDNATRFGFLSRVAADLCAAGGAWSTWQPEVLHANDWPTGLAPAYVAQIPGRRTGTVFTIHNLAFQGQFDAACAAALEIPDAWMNVDGLLHWGGLSMLKAALRHADRITTVSPTYAREIQTPELGCGMDGMLRLRSTSLEGILNGIDASVWNPRTDPHLASTYRPGQWRAKALNKRSLQAELGLVGDDDALLFGMVSRLTPQKGVDLLLANLGWLTSSGAQLVVLGRGDAALEASLVAAASELRGRVAVRLEFDEGLAHRIEAGSDGFLMPSRFEPCGLNQMYSLVYGTPPLVCATGGLADTVSDFPTDSEGTGFVLREPSPAALREAMQRALGTFADKPAWHRLQRRGMKRDFSWSQSAERYAQLYAFVAAGARAAA